MKYSEISEAVYENDKTIESLPLERVEWAAWDVLKVLNSRKGFDHWWHDAGSENQDEIFEEIITAITNLGIPS